MEERTQIKFKNPDIEGNPVPQLITLDQENPVEGTSERDGGESFVWHKWLCTDNQYFMASDSLDGMLKLIPSKMGTVLKIQKVLNPKGGYPFFEINDMNKDEIISKVNASNVQTIAPATVPQPILQSAPDTTEGALTRLEQKLDKVLALLSKEGEDPPKEEELPF
jgi:hypothetical protein